MTLLYLRDQGGNLFLTTCPIQHLKRGNNGYCSTCGATWISVPDSSKNYPSGYSLNSLIIKELSLSCIPEPQGLEIIEIYIDFKIKTYNYIDYEDSSNK